jgi:hypothetical protein
MADITSIPAARVPVLEPGSNIMSREWYRFLFNQFGQTGGGTTDVSISDLALAPFSDAETEASLGLVRDDVQGLLSAPPPAPIVRRAASFANTATQTLSSPNTATAITFNTTVHSRGIGLQSSSQIHPGVAGAFYLSLVAEMDKTGGGNALVWIWLRKNGADVPNAAFKWRVNGSGAATVFSAAATVVVGQTDYLEVMWASDTTSATLEATASTAYSPAGPSALLSITQVDP